MVTNVLPKEKGVAKAARVDVVSMGFWYLENESQIRRDTIDIIGKKVEDLPMQGLINYSAKSFRNTVEILP